MIDNSMVTVRIPEGKHAQFKAACAFLGLSMSELLRGAVDAAIARADQLRQYSDNAAWTKRSGRTRVIFDSEEVSDG